MGEAADALKSQLQETASQTAEQAMSTAERVLDAAEEQGLTPGAAREALRGAAEKVTSLASSARDSVSKSSSTR